MKNTPLIILAAAVFSGLVCASAGAESGKEAAVYTRQGKTAADATGKEIRKEVVLADGRILKNAYIISRTPAGLNIGHETGVIFIPFSRMSKARQQQYRYDPEEAKKYLEQRTKAQHDRQVRLAKKRAEEKKREEEAEAEIQPDFSARTPLEEAKNELAALLQERARLERERSIVESGGVIPPGGSNSFYISYRGGKVSRKIKYNYSEAINKNAMEKRKRLKEINTELQRNILRTNTVRNLVSKYSAGAP
ncbi:MAG: hypothetical protein PHH77_03185 [Victivallaceae bacterium]|nr:hypothetical protein [Victivallaceae bacterium]